MPRQKRAYMCHYKAPSGCWPLAVLPGASLATLKGGSMGQQQLGSVGGWEQCFLTAGPAPFVSLHHVLGPLSCQISSAGFGWLLLEWAK